METHRDLFGDQLAQMNNISARLTDRQFKAIIDEALEIAFTNFDYEAEKSFSDFDIIEALEQAIVSFIKV
tara:strand:- start:242 stop:451 length:210 start_codon:yes stop_codon:yes gene_type:complete